MTRKPLRRGRGRPKKEAPIEAAVIKGFIEEFGAVVQLLRKGKNAKARKVATFSEYVWRRLGFASSNERRRGRPVEPCEWLAFALYLDEQGVGYNDVIKNVVALYSDEIGDKDVEREFERDLRRRRKSDQAFDIARNIVIGERTRRRK